MRTSTLPTEYLAEAENPWPGLTQVYHLRRERIVDGKTSVEDEYGISSLPVEEHGAASLLVLRRAHWGIENSLHHVRDATLGEDACRVRTADSPTVLAGLRNVACQLLASLKMASIAEAARQCLFSHACAIALLFRNE